jgi:hypothetical protein
LFQEILANVRLFGKIEANVGKSAPILEPELLPFYKFAGVIDKKLQQQQSYLLIGGYSYRSSHL